MRTTIVDYAFVYFCLLNSVLKDILASSNLISIMPTKRISLFYDHPTRSMWWFSAAEPQMGPHLSLCWCWYAWPRGTRSWTPGSTSCWGGPFWGRSSRWSTAAGTQRLRTRTAGRAACSAALWRPATLEVSARPTASAEFLLQTLWSNPSHDPWSEWFWSESSWEVRTKTGGSCGELCWNKNIGRAAHRVCLRVSFANWSLWTLSIVMW